MLILAAYIWGAFWVYWLLQGMKTRSEVKKEKSGDSNVTRLTHVFLVIVGTILLIERFETLPLIGTQPIAPTGWMDAIGMAILLLSLAFSIWARFILGSSWSGAVQKVENQQLIQSGPYRYVRNPIYTGVIFGSVGTLLINASVGGLLGLVILIVAYIIKINKEQAFLIDEFGQNYLAYMKRSWALIPFIY
jgi:protein-S-isoprenylcysteine O-methyltransferase Ste14